MRRCERAGRVVLAAVSSSTLSTATIPSSTLSAAARCRHRLATTAAFTPLPPSSPARRLRHRRRFRAIADASAASVPSTLSATARSTALARWPCHVLALRLRRRWLVLQ